MKTELIKKHLEDQYTLLGGELHHFSLTGKIEGKLRLALRAMMEEYHIEKNSKRKNCNICKHSDVSSQDIPCVNCDTEYNLWEK